MVASCLVCRRRRLARSVMRWTLISSRLRTSSSTSVVRRKTKNCSNWSPVQAIPHRCLTVSRWVSETVRLVGVCLHTSVSTCRRSCMLWVWSRRVWMKRCNSGENFRTKSKLRQGLWPRFVWTGWHHSKTYLWLRSVWVSSLQEKESAEELNTEARRKLEDYKVPDVSQILQLAIADHWIQKKLHWSIFICVCGCVSGNGVR